MGEGEKTTRKKNKDLGAERGKKGMRKQEEKYKGIQKNNEGGKRFYKGKFKADGGIEEIRIGDNRGGEIVVAKMIG